MCSDPKQDLAWAMSRVQDAQRNNHTGEVRVQIHEGVIQRVRLEIVEKKPGS